MTVDKRPDMKVWLGPAPKTLLPAATHAVPAQAAAGPVRQQSGAGWPEALTLRAPTRVAKTTTFLTPEQVSAHYGQLSQHLPQELAKALEAPRVDPQWWAREAPKTVATLPGSDDFFSGRSPWLFASPLALTAPVPDDLRGFITAVPPGQAWRTGYYPILADGKQSTGAFISLLPPGFDPKNPAKGIERVVMTIGSGDNRARSCLGEYAGYDAPGTLFVSFDMQALSVGEKTPESAGRDSLRQGLAFVRRTLGIADSVPQYVAGFSAGGAATFVQSFQDFPELRGAVAMAPVIMQWDVHNETSRVPGTIPASPGNQFAKTVANGEAGIERMFTAAAHTVKSYVTPEHYAQISPQRHLARGEMPKVPLLITGGTSDALAQPVTSSAPSLASWNQGLTLPVVFGPADDQAGKTLNIEGFAQALASQPGLAVVTLEGVNHKLASDVQRPDGKAWHIDQRDLMLRFFKGLEAARSNTGSK